MGTLANPDPAYTDDPTEIELTNHGGDLLSKALLLVADDVDDDEPVGGIADDDPNDQTHKIQLDGLVSFSTFKNGTGPEKKLALTRRVEIKKTVHVTMVKCEHLLGSYCWSDNSIEWAQRYMRQRFAQSGIDLEFTVVDGSHISFDGNIETYDEVDPSTGVVPVTDSLEERISEDPIPSSDRIVMYLVERVQIIGGGFLSGVALPPKYLSTADNAAGYGNRVFVGDPGPGYSRIFTPVHESMHILLDAIHGDYPTEFGNNQMLWYYMTSLTNVFSGTKRVSQRQGDDMLASPLAR